jgi:hypothetical protein
VSRVAASACTLAFVLFEFVTPARAGQAVASATVTGIVRDSSQAVVAAAAVRLHNHDTNQVLDTTTDGAGRFRFVYVPVGEYHLSVDARGFATTGLNLTLSVGQAIDVPLALSPARVEEAVDVSAPAPIVEAGRTEVADRITPHEVDTLPLNGRNYLDLALLAPNVSRTNLRTNDRFAETSAVPGTGISVSGQRNLGNTFLVDGVSANDDAADLAGAYYGEEVIREFQVITSGGVAEFGRASAGTINVVTQSGTNQARGRAYGFFRDDAFDARNPLAVQKDPLDQQQYGLSAGGPIVKDRTFWFANVEQTRQNRTGIITIAPSDVAAINASLDTAGEHGVRIATGPYSTGYRTTNVFGRVDHQATAGSRLEVRYSIYDVGSPNARNVGGLNDVSRGTRLDDRDQTLAANYQSSLSARTINEVRAQWTRSSLSADVNDLAGPAVNISGVASFGTATFSPTARDLDVFEAVDTLTVQRGSQLIKVGADWLDNRLTIAFPGALQGVYTFSSLANVQRATYVNFQQAFGQPSQFQSNPNLGVFAQDEWRPAAGVTINAGVRYDLQWLPDPIQLDANNVSPRLGIAYTVNPRTVIRASGGLYFDRIPLRATSNALQRDGLQYKVAVLSFGQAGAPVFPAVLPSYPAAVLTAVTTIDPNIQDGYSQQASVQIERAVGNLATATVGYSHLRGHGIIMSRNINVPTLTAPQAAALGVANLGRPDPRFGNISQFDSIGDSWFNGLTLSLATRAAVWGSARVSYTLSNSQDDAGNAFFNTPQDNFNILDDKGPSDNDQRHRLVVSGNHVLHGFQVGYLLSFATGAPFNIQTGNDRNNDTNANDRPVGVGRNTGRQAATSSFDVRLSRTFVRGAAQRLEVMVEAFNLFNHVNILSVNNTFGTGAIPLSTFGQPTAAGDPRQVQLGVRWSF